MQKGCFIELSEEITQYNDFISSLLNPKPNFSLVNRISAELLTAQIESILDSKLSPVFRSGSDLLETFQHVIQVFDHPDFTTDSIAQISEFLYETGVELYRRLTDMFHDVDIGYALWNVKPINSTVALVEYLGDYRIMEWHERSGIAYDKTQNDVKYEFEISSAVSVIKSALEKHRGRYAGNFFARTISHIVNVIIEEFVFLGNNLKLYDGLTEVYASEYQITKTKLLDYFPHLTTAELSAFVVDVEQTINEYVTKPIQLITQLDEVNTWYVTDNILTINIDKPLTIVDFGERLKNDIRASIANGDWVPPKMRDIAEFY